ncbi:MAG: AAA family ATPase [Sedimentisphaerales bacterium]|nr:AAA family ATPase [Sedimentisphaerales bacterium]
MKITNLKIEGFRSLKKIDWSPGDLNVLIGPNASGKTNVLQVLELLSEAAQGRLHDYVIKRQGGMPSIMYNGKADNIAFELIAESSLESANKPLRSIYTFSMVQVGKGASYKVCNENIEEYSKPNMSAKINLSSYFKGKHEDYPDTELLLSDRMAESNKTFVPFKKSLSGWRVHRMLNTDYDAKVRQPNVTSYEHRLESDGENLIPVLHTYCEEYPGFKDRLHQSMVAAFGDDFKAISFPPAAETRIQLSLTWKSLSKSHAAASLSDGTLCFLYLLAILGNPNPPSLIAIDEPETGLHPAMLPIIASYAEEASRKSQVIISTHSPEMLSAFRGETKPTVTVAQWKDGQTQLQTLDPEHLNYWLKEYALGEMFRSGQLENMAQEDDE